jgi:hydrogenase maturation protease
MGVSPEVRPPLLVLGVGNRLLRDDGVGLELLARLEQAIGTSQDVEWIDGGTQGLALLPYLEDRHAALVLDAVSLGAAPGAVHVLHGNQRAQNARSTSAHGSSVSELLSVAALLGQLPPALTIVGIEPKLVRTGLGISPEVEAAIPEALDAAREQLSRLALCVREAAHA